MIYSNEYESVVDELYLSTLEYVAESAKYEIDDGNDQYTAVYEAATDQANKLNGNWFAKFANKIKMFAKSAIEKLKLIINRFNIFFRKTRIIMVNRKVEKLSTSIFIQINEFDYTDFDGKNTKISISDAVRNLTSNALHGSANIYNESSIYDYIASGKNVKDKKEVAKEFFISHEQLERKSDYVLKRDITTIGKFMQDLLSHLVKCPSTINGVSERLRKDNMTQSEIRYSLSALYNTITSIVKILYDNTMRLIKYFIDNSKKLGNDSEVSDSNLEDIFSHGFVEAAHTKNRNKLIDEITSSLREDIYYAENPSSRRNGNSLIALKQINYLTKNNIDIFEPDDGTVKLDGVNLENMLYSFHEIITIHLKQNFSKYKFDWCIRAIKEASKNSNNK